MGSSKRGNVARSAILAAANRILPSRSAGRSSGRETEEFETHGKSHRTCDRRSARHIDPICLSPANSRHSCLATRDSNLPASQKPPSPSGWLPRRFHTGGAHASGKERRDILGRDERVPLTAPPRASILRKTRRRMAANSLLQVSPTAVGKALEGTEDMNMRCLVLVAVSRRLGR